MWDSGTAASMVLIDRVRLSLRALRAAALVLVNGCAGLGCRHLLRFLLSMAALPSALHGLSCSLRAMQRGCFVGGNVESREGGLVSALNPIGIISVASEILFRTSATRETQSILHHRLKHGPDRRVSVLPRISYLDQESLTPSRKSRTLCMTRITPSAYYEHLRRRRVRRRPYSPPCGNH